jgi:excisionase family DNA binding protein
MPIEPTLTAREVTEIFKVSRRTLHRWEKSNALPAIRLGGTIRYVPKVVEQLLQVIDNAG